MQAPPMLPMSEPCTPEEEDLRTDDFSAKSPTAEEGGEGGEGDWNDMETEQSRRFTLAVAKAFNADVCPPIFLRTV